MAASFAEALCTRAVYGDGNLRLGRRVPRVNLPQKEYGNIKLHEDEASYGDIGVSAYGFTIAGLQVISQLLETTWHAGLVALIKNALIRLSATSMLSRVKCPPLQPCLFVKRHQLLLTDWCFSRKLKKTAFHPDAMVVAKDAARVLFQ